MVGFDPTARVLVHDKLNGVMIEWNPEWADNYREHAIQDRGGVIGWDGRLLDGWKPL